MHDLWSVKYVPAKGDIAARKVTVAFAKLVQNTKYAAAPDTSPVFKTSSVNEVAFNISSRNDEPDEGVYYLDEIVAVRVPAPSGL